MCLPEDDHGNGLNFDDEFVFENPHDEDYEYENDYNDYDDYDDFDDFEFDDEDIYYTVLYLVDSSMVQLPTTTYNITIRLLVQ